jgi:hypothetical protein
MVKFMNFITGIYTRTPIFVRIDGGRGLAPFKNIKKPLFLNVLRPLLERG